MKLNIGCFTVMYKGWLNIDMLHLDAYARERGFDFFRHDISYGLPLANESVDFIFASHVLEHVTVTDGFIFLNACHRVLKPGGVMRVAVPDLAMLCEQYQRGDFSHLADNPEVARAAFPADKFWNILTNGHKAAYDWPMLKETTQAIGFKSERKTYNVGHEVFKETPDMFPEISLYTELTK